jgi:23S rRNA pseudouridine1911/1915/1917 synthase
VGRYRVDATAAGKRLDQAAAAIVAELSVAAARRLIAAGAIRVDGRRVRKGQRAGEGQCLDVDDAALAGVRTDLQRVEPDASTRVELLALDGAFIAVQKPHGVPSHPHAAGELRTAANAIVALFPECATASPVAREGGLVHRLDTATSGVLIAARSAAAWPRLHAALAAPTCEKTYLAEVMGQPTDDVGASAQPIGRVGRRGARVRVGGGRNPLPAHTAWRVLQRRADTTLLQVRLTKGRAHQVRAHLAAAGHPIVGDALYGGPPADRLHLHAASIRFEHPDTGATILIEAPPPVWAIIEP